MSYERVETETIHKADPEHKGDGYNNGLSFSPTLKKSTMEAEQLNSLANHLEDLATRANGLRRYL
jgi:hypothetical protein